MNPIAGPGPGSNETHVQRRNAAARFRDGELSLAGLWLYYFGIGGEADEFDLDAYLHELLLLSPAQMWLVETALNETGTGTHPSGTG
ncbi:hypothetical protein SB659_18055 [Arthrobacter sp. SIMBA_036]|uniref:hypothetical protein n=1 Tax=Arthrobacter sp. SIMBA_036 TaxID=3085778 RepID=UPI00397DF3F9